jgi:predicted protein tyrosine phosphatase
MDDSTKKPESDQEEAPVETEQVAVSDEVRRQRRQRAYRALLEAKQLEIIEVPDSLIM